MVEPSSAERPWPVRTVSQKIVQWVGRLGEVWVEGQVAQLTRRPGQGSQFLVLRDGVADMSVNVVVPARVLADVVPPLDEGARVVVRARPEVYPARTSLSLQARELRRVGEGDLLARLHALTLRLRAEGLFDVDRKRPLPFLPRVVGLVCGRASDAEHDVVENARRRWPAVRLDVREVAVQGPSAVPAVTEALRSLDADPRVDVVVVARGGGSAEDLLAFSDETLVRLVASMTTPVVSAIGHESDAPLLDHVADVRASTPTDAGRRVVPDVAEQAAQVVEARRRATAAVRALVDRETQVVAAARARPVLADPAALLGRLADDVDRLRGRARDRTERAVAAAEADVARLRAGLLALGPQQVLDRGYAVLQRDDGAVVRDPAVVHHGERLHVRVAAGRLDVRAVRDGRRAPPPAG